MFSFPFSFFLIWAINVLDNDFDTIVLLIATIIQSNRMYVSAKVV